MRSIHFAVEGHLPPLKASGSSMWSTQAERLVALRAAAHEALRGASPLRAPVEVRLAVHATAPTSRSTGDLDNLVAGLLDGLQAAPAGAGNLDDSAWAGCEGYEPAVALAIEDDCEVVSIQAEKKLAAGDPWYEVWLEGT